MDLGGASGEPKSWIVINTQPNREEAAIAHITNQGYAVYCPKLKRRIRHARRQYDALRPLFPGYIFAAVDPDREQWRPLLSTVGVRTVLRNGDRPNILPGDFIAIMRAREVDGAIVVPDLPYSVGERVAIINGALEGLVGEILRCDVAGRLTILLEILNGRIKTEISTQQVGRAVQS